MKLGWIYYSPRYTVAMQRAALKEWGAQREYSGNVQDMIKHIRKGQGDVIGTYGLHRLALSWRELSSVLADIERKGATIYDLELDMAAGLASVANAKRVYAGEAIFSSGDDPKTRGQKGGRKTADMRRVPLTAKHKAIWQDIETYKTNQEAADAISKLLKRYVSVATIRRKFKASGRAGGWPVKD